MAEWETRFRVVRGDTQAVDLASAEYVLHKSLLEKIKQFDNFTDTFQLPSGIPDNQKTLDLASGDEWRALRKILSPTFTTGKLIVCKTNGIMYA